MVIVGATGTIAFLIMLGLFYYSDIRKAKARDSIFVGMEEQEFTNEMALPVPYVRTNKPVNPGEIQTQKIKSTPLSDTHENE